MNAETLKKLHTEIAPLLAGRRWGRIFPLSRFEITVDLRLPDSKYLFIGIEPANPRVYLITRRLRDIERAAVNFSPFLLGLRKHLSGGEIRNIEKLPGERVLKLELTGENEIGETAEHSLIVQLTGRSSNLFLLDDKDRVLDSARDSFGGGQEPGSIYAPPPRPEGTVGLPGTIFPQGEWPTLSEALDNHYLEREIEKTFNAKAGAARSMVRQSLARSEKLAAKLRRDLQDHGDPGEWKKFGDLLLASIATARRDDEHFYVTDFYDEALPELAIPAEKGLSLTEAAEVFFKRYTRSRNARVEIAKRLDITEAEIERLRDEQERVESAIAGRDISLLDAFAGKPKTFAASPREKKKSSDFKGARYFISSDGFEILVGKASKDNDFLTFRVARSLDTWMHAADYPGSHVVISNKSKQEIPQKTLLEAAALAAFYSNAREQPKVAVHYTQRKFVNKPKGAPPGLVSLSSFKTLLVEPGFDGVQKKEPH